MYPGANGEEEAPSELGGWRLVELLGRGGMGEVWRAEREGPGGIKRRAALKRILTRHRNDGELRQRFVAEARISARLEHSNIVQVLDFGDVPEPFLVFEYVEGISAAELLEEASRSRIKIPAVVAAFVCAEAATGLDYAHRKRDDGGRPLDIVHRDVSPHNVLLSVEGAVKVGDFGVARAADNTLRTRAGIQVGKLVYMAPEQAAGDPIDGRADVFSLGVVLWELLTLQPLFPRDDAATTLKRLAAGDIPAPSKIEARVPPALDQIVMSALDVNRERRFASAAAFAQALRGFVHSVAPGFDSSELIRILHKIAPAVSWHVPTPAPVDPARGQAPLAPRPAPARQEMAVTAMPAVAQQPAAPAAAQAQPPAQLPAQAQPQQQQQQPQRPPQAQPQGQGQQPPQGQPQARPAAPAAPAMGSGQPFAQQPHQGPPSGQHRPPNVGPSATASAPLGWQPALPQQRSMLPLVLGGIVLTVIVAVTVIIVVMARSSRDDGPSADERGSVTVAPPQPSQMVPSTPITIPSTNGLDLPVPSLADVVAPSITTTLEDPRADAGAEPAAPPPNTASARAASTIQRALSQHESEFESCVSVPSGTRARVTLRVQYDGGARTVRFVESTSAQLSLPLDAQQCLKNVAQRALADTSVSGTVTTRWSFWVETRSVLGLERGQ